MVVAVGSTGADACHGSEPTHEELLARAGDIAANARERAEETERLRRIPDETMAELGDAGLMRHQQPTLFGGLGRSSFELFELSMRLGEGCASTAWVYCVLAGHSALLGDYPIEAQHDVWDDAADAISCSAYAPTGTATTASGGFELSGKFPFSSGCDHAQWAFLGAMTSEPDGPPVHSTLLVPMSALSIDDDWHTLGLIGTGSKTLVADRVFVPAHRVMPFPPFLAGVAPFGLQAPLVGAALGGLKTFVDETKGKPSRLFGQQPRESEHYHALIGESWGDVNAAWQVLSDAVIRTEELAARGEEVPLLHIAKNRAAAAVISRLTVSAIERAYTLSGGHGVYNNHVSRSLRDVLAGTQHPGGSSQVAAGMAGAMLLSAD